MNARSISNSTNFTVGNGMDTTPVSTEPYISPAFFEMEREKVFRKAWLSMGRIEQLPQPGSYIVREVEVCKASVLITRDSNGKVRSFYNVCSHRGNTLVLAEAGKQSKFTCRYHGWTYRNDGALVAVPDEVNFFNLDKKKCALTEIATELWEGWIFINFASPPEVSLETFLGQLGHDYRDIPYENADHSVKFESTLNANWKVIADAFAESYHVPMIHPQTIGTTFASKENPFARPVAVQTWGPHRSFTTFANPNYIPPEQAHVERLAYSNVVAGNVISAAPLENMEAFLKHPAINRTKSKDWAADATWIFPNFHLDMSPGGFWTHHFWPTSYNSTRWVAEYFIPVPKDADTRLQQEHYVARNADVLLEDIGNTERTQKGLESRAKSVMPLQDAEALIRHSLFHIQKWVDAKSVTEALQ